ncbi:phage tail assembly protein [Vibrio cholerae]|nr:phage tail assembly protein [Vibrio cholerae]
MKMYQPIDITLQVPCKLDGELKPKLTMRPPTTDDVLLAQKQSRLVVNGELVEDNGEHEAHLFANLTNTTRAFIGSMSQYDYLQLQKAYDCFLLPLPMYAAKCALLFPSSVAESHSENSEG